MEPQGTVKVPSKPHVPTAVPALVALAVVVALSLAMFGWTIYLMRSTSQRSATLVNDSLQSVRLVDDLRYRITRLEIHAGDYEQTRERVLRELQEYKPLVHHPAEAAELARLRELVARGLEINQTAPERAVWFERIQGSLERLVEINARAAERTLAEIESTSHTALVGQLAAAIVVLLAASIVASMLYRVLARQRVRVEEDLQALVERNSDLAAFAGRTAHDLRGPLTPIRGYAELLAAGTADVSKAATRIRSSAERIAHILDDLMMLSTSGTLPPGEAEVGQSVRDVLADLAGQLAGATTNVSAEDCRVACASGALYQILQNLVGNACKYRSPDRALEITIECRRRDDEVALVVADNGIGMAPEAVRRAFEPYYRAAPTSEIPGAGLGLSIVRRMVEALGGRCALSSELGKGTRVEMFLPRADVVPDAPAA